MGIRFVGFSGFHPPPHPITLFQEIFKVSIDNQSQIESMLEIFQESEELISSIQLRDDRQFIRECLATVSAPDRLALVNEYLEQWQQGWDAEPDPIKSDNAGLYRANTWLRTRGEQ